MKIAFHTIGCKLNFAETSAIANTFRKTNHSVVKTNENADVIVLNSCAVTDSAEKKCKAFIKKTKAKYPNTIIAVIGCFSQLSSNRLSEMNEIDIIIGNEKKYELIDILEKYSTGNCETIINTDIFKTHRFIPGYSSIDRTRSFLKIQDGCNYYCSFCIVPLARGRSRSAGISDVINLIKEIETNGSKEVVLTGVNIGDFGRNYNGSLLQLLENIIKADIDIRIRLGSIEPELLSDEIIKLVAGSPQLMPHFHIPLQSGSDRILKLMRRKYRTGLFAERVLQIKANIPDSFIGCDIICGFPSESEYDFEESYNFVRALPLSALHVFSYSERRGTPAENILPKVDTATIKTRSKKLRKLSDLKKRNFYETFTGTTREVLLEKEKNKKIITGFTDNYIKVKVNTEHNYPVNTILKLKLSYFNQGDFTLSATDQHVE